MDLYKQTTAESYLLREKDGYRAVEEGGICYLFWNTPDYAGLNMVLAEEITAEKLHKIKEKTKGYRFGVALQKQAAEILEKNGLVFDEKAYVMSFQADVPLGFTSDLEIKKVESCADLLIWSSVVAKVFKMADAEYICRMCRGDLTIPEVSYYYGMAQGKPVGAIQTVKGSSACGIYWVAVDENFRRRGYGHDLMAAAINGVLVKGCDRFVLCSSQKGYPLYQSLGFETVYQRYDYELREV